MVDINSNPAKLFPHLAFLVDEKILYHFFLLLQQGVMVKSRIGCSVLLFLQEQFGAGPDIIEKIQSIMIDGKPVDDIRSALIKDGTTLALSAAMPGLVGATLRRGGAYSSFRSTITYQESGTTSTPSFGFVKIKLFNLLMEELGPKLLNNGILIRSIDFFNFVAEQDQEFWRGCRQITLNAKPIDAGQLQNPTWHKVMDQLVISVSSESRIE